jgi:hypothetical protein
MDQETITIMLELTITGFCYVVAPWATALTIMLLS